MARPQEFDRSEALHSSMSVFWRKGYEATSLVDLLAATGLSKSSLYGTFGGKRELFLAAFDAYRVERAREMELILGEGTAREAIERFFRMIIHHARTPEFSHGCMSTNQAVELAPHDADVRVRIEADFELIETSFARTIARGQAEGSVKNGRAAVELARLFLVAFPGFQVLVRAGVRSSLLEDGLAMLLRNLD